jgi:hypothetical protein
LRQDLLHSNEFFDRQRGCRTFNPVDLKVREDRGSKEEGKRQRVHRGPGLRGKGNRGVCWRGQ